MLHIYPKLSYENNPNSTYSIIGDTNDGIVFVEDHMPDIDHLSMEYDTNNSYIDPNYNTIKDIIKRTGYKTNHVFGESYLKWTGFDNFYTVPLYFLSLCIAYQHMNISELMYSDNVSVMALMKKDRPHRHLVSAWLNNNPCNFKYTQNFEQDNFLLTELVRCTKYEQLKSILPKYTIGPSKSLALLRSWDAISSFKMFESFITSSTFHIITEPNFFEKGCSITEKYLWCLYGFSFPIFCGSYKLPDALKEIGFDLFEDIIDHSYQYEVNPTLRTLNALQLNKNLFTNSSIKKTDYIKRHQNNLTLVRQDLEYTIDRFYKPIQKLAKEFDLSPILNLSNFKPLTQKIDYNQGSYKLIPSNKFN